MATIELSGARLYYELHGEGEGTLDDDVADLAGLIGELGLAPAHLVGHSRGGSIALRLATSQPELVRTVNAHEPPLLALLADDNTGKAQLAEAAPSARRVIAEIEASEHEAAARRFIDEVAIGEGTWEAIPPPVRARLVANADTFAEEERDPTVSAIDLEAVAELRMPLLLTYGDRSPSMFAPVIDRLEAAAPDAEQRVFEGAGHAVNLTHPDQYAAAIEGFVRGR